jgi:hypothetical protein
MTDKTNDTCTGNREKLGPNGGNVFGKAGRTIQPSASGICQRRLSSVIAFEPRARMTFSLAHFRLDATITVLQEPIVQWPRTPPFHGGDFPSERLSRTAELPQFGSCFDSPSLFGTGLPRQRIFSAMFSLGNILA